MNIKQGVEPGVVRSRKIKDKNVRMWYGTVSSYVIVKIRAKMQGHVHVSKENLNEDVTNEQTNNIHARCQGDTAFDVMK